MFRNIKAGDTVYHLFERPLNLHPDGNGREYAKFLLPVKVNRITPKRFYIGNEYYSKVDGKGGSMRATTQMYLNTEGYYTETDLKRFDEEQTTLWGTIDSWEKKIRELERMMDRFHKPELLSLIKDIDEKFNSLRSTELPELCDVLGVK